MISVKRIRILLSALLVLLIACKKADEIIVPDPEFVPPVDEIKYTNNGSFYFGFGSTGSFKFTTDVVNQYKVIITKHDNIGPTPADPTIQTFKFSKDYLLEELVFDVTATGQKTTLKFNYVNNYRLVRIEEWDGNSLQATYNITQQDNATGRKMTIGPYVKQNGSGFDTLSHTLQLDFGSEVTGVYERWRFGGPSPSLVIDSLQVYYSPQNVATMRGYNTITDFATLRDSTRQNFTYIRTPNEDPVLVEYLARLYGSDFYNILRYCKMLQFRNLSASVSTDFLILHAQRNTSETQYIFIGDIYHNGAFGGTQNINRLRENTLDAQNRLIKSKVYGSTAPNYYTWEIVYK